jgi:hypothetical protein
VKGTAYLVVTLDTEAATVFVHSVGIYSAPAMQLTKIGHRYQYADLWVPVEGVDYADAVKKMKGYLRTEISLRWAQRYLDV